MFKDAAPKLRTVTATTDLEVPPPRVDGWAAVEGTRTTYADPVPVMSHRRPNDANSADVVVAYPVTYSRGPGAPPVEQRYSVRLDFQEVYRFEYRGFYLPAQDHGAPPFCLSVSDDSAFIAEIVGYRDSVAADGPERRTSSLRHCHLLSWAKMIH